jgi:Spy/CpxP family protein refolding chaperone
MTSKINLKSIATAIQLQPAIAIALSAALAVVGMTPTLFLQPVWAAPTRESDRAQWLELTRQLLLYNVELTSQQEEKLQPIFQQAYAQMQNLLSPAQMTQFQIALREGSGLRSAIAQMQLSPVQEIQTHNIVQATGLKAAPILTPEQRSQIEANLQTLLEDS